MAAVAALLLGGCGALGGGASYRVELHRPDGTLLIARADSVESSDIVELQVDRNEADQITGLRFVKKGVEPGVWSNSVMEEALKRIPTP